MENNIENPGSNGQNRLEQVYLNMPEVRFYFSGDRVQSGENLRAYLGNDELELQLLGRFGEGEGSVYYYVLLDVSASISESEFGRITEALAEFGNSSVRSQDHMIFLTFGEDVTTLFDLSGEELSGSEVIGSIRNLKNQDQRTLLFEAVQKAAENAGGISSAESTRRVLFVITDGEDIAKGMATREEALQALQKRGIPAYGFTVAEAKRDAVNAFGEFSRATGGYLTILDPGAEGEGFSAVREEILQAYEALFMADSNQVSNGMISAVLEFAEEGGKTAG